MKANDILRAGVVSATQKNVQPTETRLNKV